MLSVEERVWTQSLTCRARHSSLSRKLHYLPYHILNNTHTRADSPAASSRADGSRHL